MKKAVSLFLAVLFVCMMRPVVFAEDADVIALSFLPVFPVSAAESLLPADAVIVIPAEATLQETAAANRLADLIDRVSGVLSAVITDDQPQSAYELAVGDTNRFAASIDGKPDGSYFNPRPPVWGATRYRLKTPRFPRPGTMRRSVRVRRKPPRPRTATPATKSAPSADGR